jgi:two-component system nitrogen regulation sensor histidine kinase NtrY
MKIIKMQSARSSLDPSNTLGHHNKRLRLSPFIGTGVVGLALLSAVVTFAVLTGLTKIEPTGKIIATALVINGLFVLSLLALIAWEVAPLWRARRSGKAAARLHVRVVAMFCGLAAIPAVIVAVVASFTLDVGLDRWFSAHTRTVIDNAFSVAHAYQEERNQAIRYDILALSQYVNRAQPIAFVDPIGFQTFLSQLAFLKGLPAVYLLHADGTVMQNSHVAREYELPKPDVIKQAKDSAEPIVITSADSDFVGAIMKLQTYDDVYLYVARPVDQNVTHAVREAQAATREYRNMEQRRANVQAAFGITYAGVALILLLIAVWFGIAFANRLVAPIRRLIAAADRVSRGNLNVQVQVRPDEGDLANLGHTFNNMTSRLKSQRDDLLQANAQLDVRRLFTEAVLSGVTAGIIGIDPQLNITLANPTALNFLGETEENVIGRPLIDVMPEITNLLIEAKEQQKLVQDEILLKRGGKNFNLLVRLTGEEATGPEHGYVVTLDDITDLVAAQRSSAWADVARRIAHEIKNPLTPIQLSAERLKRKYTHVISESERDVFDQCTDTIIRQVSDIGRMVDEFSSFARMPKAQIMEEDVGDLVRQVVFLMRVGNPDIEFSYIPPKTMIRAECDRRLIAQAVTNLIKNATEAITTIDESDVSGRIDVRVFLNESDQIVIDVEDDGIGLPQENRQRLLEPYMTTRKKGTGLGLAIVSKVLDEHAGTVELLDGKGREGRPGALIRLIFPRARQTAEITPFMTSQQEMMGSHVQ